MRKINPKSSQAPHRDTSVQYKTLANKPRTFKLKTKQNPETTSLSLLGTAVLKDITVAVIIIHHHHHHHHLVHVCGEWNKPHPPSSSAIGTSPTLKWSWCELFPSLQRCWGSSCKEGWMGLRIQGAFLWNYLIWHPDKTCYLCWTTVKSYWLRSPGYDTVASESAWECAEKETGPWEISHLDANKFLSSKWEISRRSAWPLYIEMDSGVLVAKGTFLRGLKVYVGRWWVQECGEKGSLWSWPSLMIGAEPAENPWCSKFIHNHGSLPLSQCLRGSFLTQTTLIGSHDMTTERAFFAWIQLSAVVDLLFKNWRWW